MSVSKKEYYVSDNETDKNRKKCHCQNVTQKLVVFCRGQKLANQGDSVASPATPVQAVGTKIIFLASSKYEDYTDIDLIHYILVFRKTEIFPHVFSPS